MHATRKKHSISFSYCKYCKFISLISHTAFCKSHCQISKQKTAVCLCQWHTYSMVWPWNAAAWTDTHVLYTASISMSRDLSLSVIHGVCLVHMIRGKKCLVSPAPVAHHVNHVTRIMSNINEYQPGSNGLNQVDCRLLLLFHIRGCNWRGKTETLPFVKYVCFTHAELVHLKQWVFIRVAGEEDWWRICFPICHVPP